jgi:four helix bundle protein
MSETGLRTQDLELRGKPSQDKSRTGARRFEDLIAWQKARALTKEIYVVTASADFTRDRGLCDQIRRASVSIMANLAEGFDRGARTEFHRFLVIAKGSCAELRSHLYVALDASYIAEATFKKLYAKVDEVSRILGGLRQAVQRQRDSK